MVNTFPICSIPVKIFNQFANFHDQILQSVWVVHLAVNFLSVFHYFGWFQPKIHFQFQKTNLLQFPTNFFWPVQVNFRLDFSQIDSISDHFFLVYFSRISFPISKTKFLQFPFSFWSFRPIFGWISAKISFPTDFQFFRSKILLQFCAKFRLISAKFWPFSTQLGANWKKKPNSIQFLTNFSVNVEAFASIKDGTQKPEQMAVKGRRSCRTCVKQTWLRNKHTGRPSQKESN